jgi:hypothetical protein
MEGGDLCVRVSNAKLCHCHHVLHSARIPCQHALKGGMPFETGVTQHICTWRLLCFLHTYSTLLTNRLQCAGSAREGMSRPAAAL